MQEQLGHVGQLQARSCRSKLPHGTMSKRLIRGTLIIGLAALPLAPAAHHSAALFYDVQARVTLSGTVSEFRFSNPHAILLFDVVGDDGEIQHWTAETTSPSVLRRRGWSQQSFSPGEKVRLEGMPSKEGLYLMRITRAFREDGSEIGVPAGTDN